VREQVRKAGKLGSRPSVERLSPRLTLANANILSDAVRHTVVSLLVHVAREIVMPRYRTLQSTDISEKSPGETVTIVDHEAEAALHEGLRELLPGARIVGEEAASDDPGLLEHLDEGLVWLIDPVDGTSNFSAGKPPFGVMIALVSDGQPVAAWLYDPLARRLCRAERGRGAFIDDVAARVTSPARRPVASLATQFMTAEMRSGVESAFAKAFDLAPIPRCAAEHYPRLVLGGNQVALFQRTLPWDHVAGALFLAEAGGRVARWDGSPYRVGDGKIGILAASHDESWETALNILRVINLPDDMPVPFQIAAKGLSRKGAAAQ